MPPKVAPKTIAAPDLRPPRLLKLSGVKCAGGMRDGAIDLAPRPGGIIAKAGGFVTLQKPYLKFKARREQRTLKNV